MFLLKIEKKTLHLELFWLPMSVFFSKDFVTEWRRIEKDAMFLKFFATKKTKNVDEQAFRGLAPTFKVKFMNAPARL